MVIYVLQTIFHSKLKEGVRNMETAKFRMQKVHGCKETYEPEKLYQEEQKNNRVGD
jgi:hypothetical protein